jgi:hypothetical protein
MLFFAFTFGGAVYILGIDTKTMASQMTRNGHEDITIPV